LKIQRSIYSFGCEDHKVFKKEPSVFISKGSEDMQAGQEHPFELEVNAPYSLNYLIFLQNIFLNQIGHRNGRLLFPYLDSGQWRILDQENFHRAFKEVWEEIFQRNLDRRFDHNGILEEQKFLYLKLFKGQSDHGYIESTKAFYAWWDGFAGKIAVERVFDDDSMNKIYLELADSIETSTEHNRLTIDLVYDRPVLSEHCSVPWYLVLPIEDVFLKNRRREVTERMRLACR
jgi:hypothetical protein